MELLVVIAIIALLAALLSPALKSAREKGRQIQCMCNMRQVFIAMNAYANDNEGCFPLTPWGAPTTLCSNTSESPGGGYLPGYFPDTRVLRCPSGQRPPGWWAFYDPSYDRIVWWSTYYFLAATGTHGPDTYVTDGWAYSFRPMDTGAVGGPCPRTSAPGTWLPNATFGSVYVRPADRQPAILDGYAPGGTWVPYAANPIRNNHANGLNVLFVDGHAEWHSGTQATNSFYVNNGYIYW